MFKKHTSSIVLPESTLIINGWQDKLFGNVAVWSRCMRRITSQQPSMEAEPGALWALHLWTETCLQMILSVEHVLKQKTRIPIPPSFYWLFLSRVKQLRWRTCWWASGVSFGMNGRRSSPSQKMYLNSDEQISRDDEMKLAESFQFFLAHWLYYGAGKLG